MTTFPSIDLSSFELPTINLPKVDLRKVDLSKLRVPKFDVPKVDLPSVTFPKVELPKIQAPALPQLDTDSVIGLTRDAAYAGLGLTVLAVQQAENGRRAVQHAVTRGVRKVAATVT